MNHKNHSAPLAFDRAFLGPMERFLLHLRARSLNPKEIARDIELLHPKLQSGPLDVLEVGCGIGAKTPMIKNVVKKLGSKSVKIDSIDISSVAIKHANKRGMKNVNYYHADFFEWEGKYNYIFIIAAWQYLGSPQKAIEKITHLLKPNGTAIIINNFFPESPVLQAISKVLYALYLTLVDRKGMAQNGILVSEIEKAVKKNKGITKKGVFTLNFPAIFAKGIVLHKKD